MNGLNYINHINENKVNNIFECHLLYHILNYYKFTKNRNTHHYPILHVCINARSSRENIYILKILLYSGCSSTILIRRLIIKLRTKKGAMIQCDTQAGNIKLI